MLCGPDEGVPQAGPVWTDRAAAMVREHGWTVVAVPGDDRGPAFAYTVGLYHTLRAPELAMFGLPPEVMHTLLNLGGGRVRDGAPVADGTRWEGLLASGLPLALRHADLGWYRAFFGQAVRFHRAAFPVRQVVWTDRVGTFPWQDGFDEAWRERQPALWLPPARHPAGPWTALLEDV